MTPPPAPDARRDPGVGQPSRQLATAGVNIAEATAARLAVNTRIRTQAQLAGQHHRAR